MIRWLLEHSQYGQRSAVAIEKLFTRNSAAWTLIPMSSVASRALVTVVAIMTFLATLTLGAALLVREASSDWSSAIRQEMTIQIRPIPGRNLDRDVEAAAKIALSTSGVQDVRVLSRQESGALLEPWMGKGLNLDELPVPRLIVIRPAPGFAHSALEKALTALPGATLDDHKVWFEHLSTMAGSLVLISLFILALVVSAMVLVIVFATRGAMATTKHIIETLHFVGAKDQFISRQFQMNFFRLGLKGSLIGGAGTLLFFALTGTALQYWQSSIDAAQARSLFGSFSLGWSGALMIVFGSLLSAVLVGYISRYIVSRQLQLMR